MDGKQEQIFEILKGHFEEQQARSLASLLYAEDKQDEFLKYLTENENLDSRSIMTKYQSMNESSSKGMTSVLEIIQFLFGIASLILFIAFIGILCLSLSTGKEYGLNYKKLGVTIGKIDKIDTCLDGDKYVACNPIVEYKIKDKNYSESFVGVDKSNNYLSTFYKGDRHIILFYDRSAPNKIIEGHSLLVLGASLLCFIVYSQIKKRI